MPEFSLSIHIFRRDLRLDDNTALLAALKRSGHVLPVFIFDERQLASPYKGNNSFEFMIKSLTELDCELKKKGSKLYFLKGAAHEIIVKLIDQTKAQAVFVNRDYTPFSRERDGQIGEACLVRGVQFFSYADALLTEPEQVKKADNTPYTMFTPFKRKARLLTVPFPVMNNLTNYFSEKIQNEVSSPLEMLASTNPELLIKGGRNEALQLLSNIGRLDQYDELRNFPAVRGTSLLSAHHKFGTISIRETYHKITDSFDSNHTLINELYWRDFFSHIAFNFPHVFGNNFHRKYNSLEWVDDKTMFERWCNGHTGFPIVDAGMRELVTTGYMHNRVRMIVASFLTKDLHIDWHWGERFFAMNLIDYDPAVNNGNWQWAASTGCDAQPYFRIFNPWSQQQKFDPECIYIKHWVPELRDLSAREIHYIYQSNRQITSYPIPVADHSREVIVAKTMFSKLK